MALRAVVNSNGIVIADGTAEFSNSGDVYISGEVSGVWSSFSYDSYPPLGDDIISYVSGFGGMCVPLCYQAVSGAIALRALADIQSTPNG